MAGYPNAFAATELDGALVNGDKIQWSENGSSESTNLAATTITTWQSATVADPSVKANSGAYESAAATGACTITHFRVVDTTEATIRTDWTALDNSRTLGIGDKLSIANGDIYVSLT